MSGYVFIFHILMQSSYSRSVSKKLFSFFNLRSKTIVVLGEAPLVEMYPSMATCLHTNPPFV